MGARLFHIPVRKRADENEKIMAAGSHIEPGRHRIASRLVAYITVAAIALLAAYSRSGWPVGLLQALTVLAILGLPVSYVLLRASARRPPSEARASTTPTAAPEGAIVQAEFALKLAMIPLTGTGDDPDHARFTDGFSMELLALLSATGQIPVASRTSCFALKGKHVDLKSLANNLQASHALDGELGRSEDGSITLDLRLRDTGIGSTVWSESYAGGAAEIFDIQEQVVRKLGKALGVDVETDARENSTTSDPQAYQAYMTGHGYFIKGGLADLAHAVRMFAQATEADPGFVRAWTDLAETYALQAIYYEGSDAERKAAHDASQKAVALAPDRGDTHVARGIAHLASEEYEDAARECDLAIQLDPSLWKAYYNYARASYHQGRMRQAVELFEKAANANPCDYQSLLLAAPIYRRLEDGESFERAAREGVMRAERFLEDHPDNHRAYYLGAGILLDLGERERAFEWAERALAIDPSDPSIRYNMGCFYAKAGENDRAFECLHDSITSRSWIENDPDLDPIREDPRYQRLLDSLE